MKENKLIAEFMGYEIIYRPNSNGFIEISDTELCDVDDLEYHTSWDWLMPVVVRLFDDEYNEFDGADDLSFRLNDTLLETNLDSLHSIVVEFINAYNKNI
jgi:hypothetical protein